MLVAWPSPKHKYHIHLTAQSDTWVNSVDPDQTAPKGAVWSGSTLFTIQLELAIGKSFIADHVFQNQLVINY